MVTFGFELEVSSGALDTLAHLHELGLTEHRSFHAYHCACSMCFVRPGTASNLFKAQNDCTADGEIITHVLEYGTPLADRAIVGLSRALLMAGADTSGSVGNHVHVDHRALDALGKMRLNRLFARYETELHEIAAASFDSMRTYNGRDTAFDDSIWNLRRDHVGYIPQRGHTIAWKNPTVEFRLWNSTRAAWRIRTHVGLSVAMVLAAENGVEVEQNDPRCVEDVIGDYIDAPTWAGILRQRFSKGGAAEVAA